MHAHTLSIQIRLAHTAAHYLALEFHWFHSCIQRNKAAGQKNLKSGDGEKKNNIHQKENSDISREESRMCVRKCKKTGITLNNGCVSAGGMEEDD